MEPCHGSGPLCPQTSGEVAEPEEEEREAEEELPPSVKLGIGYTKPHYQVRKFPEPFRLFRFGQLLVLYLQIRQLLTNKKGANRSV